MRSVTKIQALYRGWKTRKQQGLTRPIYGSYGYWSPETKKRKIKHFGFHPDYLRRVEKDEWTMASIGNYKIPPPPNTSVYQPIPIVLPPRVGSVVNGLYNPYAQPNKKRKARRGRYVNGLWNPYAK